ncbi:MAG: YkgJ family cysteine cluster protein [Planctomycetes bacterium]|nr:YkgJ family cysteine cluster protein [Planctomycetota bacterium]
MADGKSKAEAAKLLRDKRAGRWYEAGLNFRCQAPGCSDCCSGKRGEGYVWLTADEMQAIADFLGLEFDTFTRKYVRQVDYAFSLTEKPNNDCIFLKDGGCSVYPVRPTQCRTYPFWPNILRAPETWAKEAQQCPGIGADTLVDADEIENQLEQDLEGRRRTGIQ